MRKIILYVGTIAAVLIGYNAQAQSDSYFSMFEYAQNVFNPGAAGSNGALCATSIHRQQWTGFGEGRPQTTIITVDMPVNSISSGLGFTVNNDILGFQSDLSIGLNYAYRLETDLGMIGIGLGVGVLNRSLDGDWITPGSLAGETVYGDPAIPHMESKTALDFNLGVSLVGENYWAGLSTTHLLSPKINFNTEAPSRVARHYYLTGGYIFAMPNPSFDVLASSIVQLDGASYSVNINGKILFEKRFWGGLSYRLASSEAVVLMVGMHMLNGISFGYSYDISVSDIGSYNTGSHEIMLRYCFNVEGGKTPGKYRSVRSL